MKYIIFFAFLMMIVEGMRLHRDMNPNNEECLEVMQEIIGACFVPAQTMHPDVWHIRLLETTLGYISRNEVNYVFATLGYTDEPTRDELYRRVATSSDVLKVDIRAKPVKRSLINNLARSNGPLDTVEIIEKATGKLLDKTRAYIAKYATLD